MNILIIEDETALADALCQTMKNEHYVPTAVYDGETGLYEALTDIYDIIILDIMLPKKNGFEILKELRQKQCFTPVILLTAKSDVESKVTGLDSGANYYLTKPFETQELLACIRALTRHTGTATCNTTTLGDLELQTKQGCIYCTATGKYIKMSAKELNLLELLMKNKGMILNKEYLTERIWGYDSEAEYNNIEVYISFLRKKIAFVGSKVNIKSTRGLGYSLEVQP